MFKAADIDAHGGPGTSVTALWLPHAGRTELLLPHLQAQRDDRVMVATCLVGARYGRHIFQL